MQRKVGICSKQNSHVHISQAANTLNTICVWKQRSAFEFALNSDRVENSDTEEKGQGKKTVLEKRNKMYVVATGLIFC